MRFHRKTIRLQALRYVGQFSYFITFCCARRRPVFANTADASSLIDKLRERSVANRFAVHAYCVMPDHFHALVAGLDPASNLILFVKNLKQTTAHEYQKKSRETLWQKKFHDHILRPRDNAEAIAAYIWMNLVRQGLCNAPHEYPYSGSLTIDWKKAVSPVESWTPEWKKPTLPT